MGLFSATVAVQWCYPSDIALRIGTRAFMSIIALVVVACIWTARDQCDFCQWWFQPDPNQPEHTQGEEDNKAYSRLDFLQRMRISLTTRMVKPIPCESHAIQDTPNLWEEGKEQDVVYYLQDLYIYSSWSLLELGKREQE
ncbi:hypothetical protein L210DRAFT_3511448 [Boletus edulis BED1]|uniref:Uncharacterized protein n=1 Tax=Boletus edulis BED1 TaxID=1328754 RepID=A0AAD4G5T8_BOLED|nr:hypothetical protein L210DRAFT_3511448 [Boletus edulis BED1]